jgi:hypothetical protein
MPSPLLLASRKANPRSSAMQAVQTVPTPTLTSSPIQSKPLSGSSPTVSPAAMKKGGKVAGKLATRGYGKIK